MSQVLLWPVASISHQRPKIVDPDNQSGVSDTDDVQESSRETCGHHGYSVRASHHLIVTLRAFPGNFKEHEIWQRSVFEFRGEYA